MKIIDLFMVMLVLNALADINAYSFIIFGCATVCLVCRIMMIMRKG